MTSIRFSKKIFAIPSLQALVIAFPIFVVIVAGIAAYMTLSGPQGTFYSSLFLLTLTGLLLGSIYALVSSGLTIIYGTMDLVNFSQGSFVMLSMFTAYWLFTFFNIDPYIAIPIAAALFFGIGLTLEKTIIERVLDKPLVSQFLITFAIMTIAENSAVLFWSVDARAIRTGYTYWFVNVMGGSLSVTQIVAFVVSVAVTSLGYLFLTRTSWGLALRSTAQNRELASIVGVNIFNVYTLSFGMGLALTSIGGVLLSTYLPFYPYSGADLLLVAFLVVVLGGLGNYMGALFSGFIIGVTESIFAFVFGPQFKQISYLTLFIIILLLKPEGIFSK